MQPDDFPITTKNSREALATKPEKFLEEYRHYRFDFIEWLINFGKDPDNLEGYSEAAVRDTAYRTDRFFRWLWTQYGEYRLDFTHKDGDEYLMKLAVGDTSGYNKASSQTTLKRLFKYEEYKFGMEEWEPEFDLSSKIPKTTQPRDFLTIEERRKLERASMKYGTIPAYNDLSPDQRDRWKAHLAKRFGKKKENVSPEDWDKANGWKVPSLVMTSLDAGLRPIEVEKMTVKWIDLDNGLLRISANDSAKNDGNWRIELRSKTLNALDHWLNERSNYEKYEETNSVWLTREGNPWSSQSLRYLIRRLADIAEIDYENRKLSWYSIRHSTGTYLSRQEGLKAAKNQLRHKSIETTSKYDQIPDGTVRDALDNIN